MATFNLDNITAALSDLKDEGISFSGKQKKWETEEDAKELVAAINECKVLQYLDLEGNTLGVEAAKSIGKALEKHPEFQKALFKDLFTGRMKTEIPIALENLGRGMIAANAKITVLDCSDNALGPNGMKGLVDLIKSPTCFSLQELKLNNCGLGITGGKMLSQSLTECFEKSVKAGTPLSLKVFVAGRNRLENDGAKALAEIFGKIKTLEEITVPQNGIYWPGMTALSEALKENTNLQILNLNDNTIGPKGANVLADAFYSLQALKEINFGDCLLKSEGTLALAEALGDGHSDLEVVNFSGNEIGPEGGESLVASMYGKDNLRQLILDSNCFGDESIDIMRDTMERYNKIENLSIEDDEGIDDEETDNGDYDDDENGEEIEEEEEDEYQDEAESDNDSEGVLYIPDTSIQNQSTFETSLNAIGNESTNGEVPEEGTVSAFCYQQNPTIDLFNQIKDQDKVAAFQDYLKAVPEDEYLIHLVFTILKCASVSDDSKEALNISDALFKDAFEYAKNNNRLKSLRNFFLIQLGLLKAEEKKFVPSYNIKACRTALENVMKHNIVPTEEKNIFETFLNAAK